MQLYGKQWKRRELEAHVGRIEQIGGIRRLRAADGPEEGVEQIQVRTGAGLTYYVSPSRGLDIGLAEFGGSPISWMSGNGEQHPAYYDPTGTAWLRTAAGGLLMTCGITQAGSPGVDAGTAYGLHGRAHHLPARQVAAEASWEEDEYEIRIRGYVEETSMFGESLRLTRTIASRLGENAIRIHDVVENIGFQPAGHMLLYHFNFGFPLMGPQTRVEFPAADVAARDEGVPLQGMDGWQAPQPNMVERVYYHRLHEPTSGNRVEAAIINNDFPAAGTGGTQQVKVTLSWTQRTLPRLVQWYMPGEGVHALGIEPANCWVGGREAARAADELRVLAPGETVDYELELRIE